LTILHVNLCNNYEHKNIKIHSFQIALIDSLHIIELMEVQTVRLCELCIFHTVVLFKVAVSFLIFSTT